MEIDHEEFPWFFTHFGWAIDGIGPQDERSWPTTDIRKEYGFEGPEGKVRLADLFGGRGRLLICHFMFDPSWDKGCPDCSAGADQIRDRHLRYLHDRDIAFVYVSRAPLAKLEAYKHSKGWSFPWYSSYESDYNYDFQATTANGEVPGGSFFRREGESVLQILGPGE
jgi:predicted dithiol-disulfide oxidoreductase (DUF899 family)